jgi:tRNA(adenine34) deaminase
MTDEEYLEQALQLAQQSSEPIGCGSVIISNGEVIAQAYNSQRVDEQAVNHAEIKTIVAANQKTGARKLENATIYCSCEPCAMCLAAISYANIRRVVFNKKMIDLFPNDKQARFNSEEFVKTLNFVPVMQQLLI